MLEKLDLALGPQFRLAGPAALKLFQASHADPSSKSKVHSAAAAGQQQPSRAACHNFRLAHVQVPVREHPRVLPDAKDFLSPLPALDQDRTSPLVHPHRWPKIGTQLPNQFSTTLLHIACSSLCVGRLQTAVSETSSEDICSYSIGNSEGAAGNSLILSSLKSHARPPELIVLVVLRVLCTVHCEPYYPEQSGDDGSETGQLVLSARLTEQKDVA